MSLDMSREAIQARWATGYARRDAGGWARVSGQPDPRADIEALLAMVADKPKKRRKPRLSVAVDSRGPGTE